MITVCADDYCPVECIVDGVFQKRKTEMDISFLFFVTLPLCAAIVAACGFLAKPGHVARNPNVL
jgi:hypothetical protein